MHSNNKKAFTVVELLIGIAILSLVVGIAIIFMARGASNVQKGSFNALAANQAAWICSIIRNDMARSDREHIQFECEPDEAWDGSKTFKVQVEGGTATYSIEKRGNSKIFIRTFESDGSDNNVFENKRQTFGDEFMADMTVTRAEDGSYAINIIMQEYKKDGNSENNLSWSATIHPPSSNGLGKYWVPTIETVTEN